jgi:hypothetical protein
MTFDLGVFAAEKCSCIFCIHAIHGNKRSEAISRRLMPKLKIASLRS